MQANLWKRCLWFAGFFFHLTLNRVCVYLFLFFFFDHLIYLFCFCLFCSASFFRVNAIWHQETRQFQITPLGFSVLFDFLPGLVVYVCIYLFKFICSFFLRSSVVVVIRVCLSKYFPVSIRPDFSVVIVVQGKSPLSILYFSFFLFFRLLLLFG